MLDTRCSMLEPRYWILNTESSLDARHSMLDARCSILDTGH
ncbi:MAG: hypothetical protein AB1797_07505 [bacterium]